MSKSCTFNASDYIPRMLFIQVRSENGGCIVFIDLMLLNHLNISEMTDQDKSFMFISAKMQRDLFVSLVGEKNNPYNMSYSVIWTGGCNMIVY